MEMTPFAVFDPATSRVLRSGVCQSENFEAQAGPGEQVIAARPPNWYKQWTVSIVGGIPAFTEFIELKTLSEQKAELLLRLAQRRWEIETGGVTVGAVQVSTDDRSKLLVTDAARKAEADPKFSTRWKAKNGWRDLNAAQIIAARDAVFNHVQRCFDREAELSALVETATPQTIGSCQSAVEAFWP